MTGESLLNANTALNVAIGGALGLAGSLYVAKAWRGGHDARMLANIERSSNAMVPQSKEHYLKLVSTEDRATAWIRGDKYKGAESVAMEHGHWKANSTPSWYTEVKTKSIGSSMATNGL
ncbi:hypothetical protein MMC18_002872 [Xylographa bjoerkii]|nr:hypothetical protein [Xylographa bjoerkii]